MFPRRPAPGAPGLGLDVHGCLVDCARAAVLFPLGWSLLTCQV